MIKLKIVFSFMTCVIFLHASGMTYGVAAHISRGDASPDRLRATLDAMTLAGMSYVRTDFDSMGVLCKNGTYDFREYDRIVNAVRQRGLNVLPILYGPNGTHPPKDAEGDARYALYVRSVVEHFKDRIPVWEIWNEANLSYFFDGADPVEYARVLKIAFRTIKSVDPRLKVAFGGTSGIPYDWIRKVFSAGATNCFDIMNIHPYSHPYAPEESLGGGVKKLREEMGRYGIGSKPVWVTELGWPTHEVSFFPEDVLLAGLKMARPEKNAWIIAVADVASSGEVDQGIARRLQNLLPRGSRVRAYNQDDLNKIQSVKSFDAVVYPFDETYPIDTTNVVNRFIKEGGTIVDFGGVPCYFGRRDGRLIERFVHGEGLAGFPYGSRAFWSEGGKKYPREARTYVTRQGLEMGISDRKSGFATVRFLAQDRLESKDEWIPLLAGKTAQGVDLVSAAVVRYHGSRKGAAVLSTVIPRGVNSTNSEDVQAQFTARALVVAAMSGIDAYFTYNLRASEDDPFYSESHFGLMHAGFQPKPAFSAYANFTRERPAGSDSKSIDWDLKDLCVCCPQWRRPDGVSAGALWTTGDRAENAIVCFCTGTPRFRNVYGKPLVIRQESDGSYVIPVDGSPVYFSGAELLSHSLSIRTDKE